VKSGKLRGLGIATLKRSAFLPDLPTIAESGYPGFEALAWNGLFSPAGTPAEVVARINGDVNAVMKEPAVIEALLKQGLIIGGGTPAEFKAFIDSEGQKWGAIIKRVGITID
jgi:tripartite-type tricarboxylate transporter receptor subunit TctC